MCVCVLLSMCVNALAESLHVLLSCDHFFIFNTTGVRNNRELSEVPASSYVKKLHMRPYKYGHKKKVCLE